MTQLAEARWPALGHVDVVLVPLGSTEQHGPHLPFDTDTVVAAACARELGLRLRALSVASVVAPAVPYGASGEHQDFPGTSSIGETALRLVLIELVRSIRQWAPRVVLVNAHGGNATAVAAAVCQLRDEGHDVAWAPCGTGGGDAHAGRTETSLMLALAPQNVSLPNARAGATAPIGELMPTLRLHGVRAVSGNGVLGDPAAASAQEGAALLDEIAGALVRRVCSGDVDRRGMLRDPGPGRSAGGTPERSVAG